MLVSGHQDVVLQSEVSGPGPRHVEHVLLPLQALPADPVLQDHPGARLSTGRNKLRFKNNCEGARCCPKNNEFVNNVGGEH